MGWKVRLWLVGKPFSQQCRVFVPFAAVGAAIVWGGMTAGSGRAVAIGFLFAAAWPFDMYVFRPLSLSVQRWLRGGTTP
jgi:hypothetical protein